MRVEALNGLRQPQAAEHALREAIGIHPADANLHSLQGETLLAASRTAEAGDAYREALRLDPQLPSARRGLAEVLQRRSGLYRLFKAYTQRVGALTPRQKMLLGLAFLAALFSFVGYGSSLQDSSLLRNVVTQLLISATLLFWCAQALFDLSMSFDRLGRYTLTEAEIRRSRWVGGLLVPFVGLSIASWLVSAPYDETLRLQSWCAATVVYPAVRFHRCERGWPRTAMTVYYAAVVVVAVLCGSIVAYLGFQAVGLLREGNPDSAYDTQTVAIFVAMPLLLSGIISMSVSNRLARVRLPRSTK
jgi:hypothetical protein